MRLMGILDWLLACKEFLLTNVDNPFTDEGMCVQDRARVAESMFWNRT